MAFDKRKHPGAFINQSEERPRHTHHRFIAACHTLKLGAHEYKIRLNGVNHVKLTIQQPEKNFEKNKTRITIDGSIKCRITCK